MKKIIKSFTINKNNVNLNNDYICLVKIKKYNKSVPMCKYPKQKVSVIDRPPLRVYYNYNDEIIKKRTLNLFHCRLFSMNTEQLWSNLLPPDTMRLISAGLRCNTGTILNNTNPTLNLQ